MPGKSLSPTPLPVQRALRALAQHCADWRKLRGMTEAQLAERSGVSRDTVRNLEKGRSIGTENLLKIARGLGLLDQVTAAFDPLNSDVGRLRAGEQLPTRVRPRRLTGGDSL